MFVIKLIVYQRIFNFMLSENVAFTVLLMKSCHRPKKEFNIPILAQLRKIGIHFKH